MDAEPALNKGTLWRAVAVMSFISCLLTAAALLEFVVDGHLSLFASLELVIGSCGIAVTVVAWRLTFVL
jgi:hypothetical protein